MKKIRIGNDIPFAWEFKRGGAVVNLNEVIDITLTYRVARLLPVEVPPTDYEITENGAILINSIAGIATRTGVYNFELTYYTADMTLTAQQRKNTVDADVFYIVDKSAKADEITELTVTSDLLIALKGKDGSTPEIGDNGNWFIDGVDTGLNSKGENLKFSDLTPSQKEEITGGITTIEYSDKIYNDIII